MGELAQAAHVLVLDVAAVLAQVDRDAVGAAEMRFDRRPHGVGLVGSACLPHGRHVIYVDAELNHKSLNSLRTVRVCNT